MYAILLAGGRIQSNEPLYSVTRGGLGAMIEIAGKPMIQWVLNALDQSTQVEHIIIAGLPVETMLECSKPVTMIGDQESVIKNIQAGAEEILRLDPSATHALISTADIPTIRPEMVDWIIEQACDQQSDIYYSVIERSVMEQAFPHAKKTYMHLKNLVVCGGDLHCFRLQFARQENPLWDKLFAARKSPLRQAALLGYDTLLILLLRQMDLAQAESIVSERLKLKGRALLCPYPQLGMDVDKLAHLEMIRAALGDSSG